MCHLKTGFLRCTRCGHFVFPIKVVFVCAHSRRKQKNNPPMIERRTWWEDKGLCYKYQYHYYPLTNDFVVETPAGWMDRWGRQWHYHWRDVLRKPGDEPLPCDRIAATSDIFYFSDVNDSCYLCDRCIHRRFQGSIDRLSVKVKRAGIWPGAWPIESRPPKWREDLKMWDVKSLEYAMRVRGGEVKPVTHRVQKKLLLSRLNMGVEIENEVVGSREGESNGEKTIDDKGGGIEKSESKGKERAIDDERSDIEENESDMPVWTSDDKRWIRVWEDDELMEGQRLHDSDRRVHWEDDEPMDGQRLHDPDRLVFQTGPHEESTPGSRLLSTPSPSTTSATSPISDETDLDLALDAEKPKSFRFEGRYYGPAPPIPVRARRSLRELKAQLDVVFQKLQDLARHVETANEVSSSREKESGSYMPVWTRDDKRWMGVGADDEPEESESDILVWTSDNKRWMGVLDDEEPVDADPPGSPAWEVEFTVPRP
ncbi:hypothetical protein B0H66DRAFT_535302 [Apodospora peruviana]|uniref:Uncharacterized protein n=1 Tax=Apodospora peruviana TaxID=516989 RepID=A0AAE0I2P1_9PEZI|nr:hypothetical protein B0H66DRAFT_535302 [Apodospora peruviana]